MDKKQLVMIAAGGAAVTLVGLFLPWVSLSDEGIGGALKALGKSASFAGIEGSDGKIVLVLAAIAGALAGAQVMGKSLVLSARKGLLVAGICLALAAAICVIDFLDISGPVSVGFGLYLSLLGSIAGTVTAFLAWKQTSAEPTKAATA
ncbi:MAG: hypothetical protein QNJ98_19775 [Planctomycetota bacterium]|nr:hypothetical protein [Planctomycetota bacterium]